MVGTSNLGSWNGHWIVGKNDGRSSATMEVYWDLMSFFMVMIGTLSNKNRGILGKYLQRCHQTWLAGKPTIFKTSFQWENYQTEWDGHGFCSHVSGLWISCPLAMKKSLRTGKLHIEFHDLPLRNGNWLVVFIPTPLKNMSSSVGIMKLPRYGKS